MTDTNLGQEPTAEPQAGAGEAGAALPQPTEVVTSSQDEGLTPEQLRANLTKANAEAAASRIKLREAEKKIAEAEKLKTAEAERLAAEQGRFQDLYEAANKRAEEAEARLKQIEQDGQKRDAAQAAGIPLLWQRLQGGTPEEFAEDAKKLAALMSPAGGTPARAGTAPTPAAQGRQALTDEERRALSKRTF